MVSTKGLVENLIGILTGPTASGKTSLALRLADEARNIEIINADSLLVYQGMDIGTAKPTSQELAQVPHHLVNILPPDQAFTAGDFKKAAEAAISDIHSRGKRALIVGGTGFYLKALLFGTWKAPPADPELRIKLGQLSSEDLHARLCQVDPQSAQRIGSSDTYRLIRALEIFQLTGKSPTELQNELPTEPDPRFRLWIIDRPAQELEERIRLRTKQMIQDGLIEEYKKIFDQYPESRALQSIGYAQVSDFLQGRVRTDRKIKPGLEGLTDEINLATRQLVKSQRTWFRGQLRGISQAQSFLLDEELQSLEKTFQEIY